MNYQMPVKPPPASARLPTEERQALIVAAAITLAGRHSPAAITTGDIAREVGVTQGALFKHFPSRDEGHIDPDLFALLLSSGVYRQYAERYMPSACVDEVDVVKLLGRQHY